MNSDERILDNFPEYPSYSPVKFTDPKNLFRRLPIRLHTKHFCRLCLLRRYIERVSMQFMNLNLYMYVR